MSHWHFLAVAGTTLACIATTVACLRPYPKYSPSTSNPAATDSRVLPRYSPENSTPCATPDASVDDLSADAVVRAHQVMQRHRRCRVGACAEKTAAFDTLVAVGRIVPDSFRTNHHR